MDNQARLSLPDTASALALDISCLAIACCNEQGIKPDRSKIFCHIFAYNNQKLENFLQTIQEEALERIAAQNQSHQIKDIKDRYAYLVIKTMGIWENLIQEMLKECEKAFTKSQTARQDWIKLLLTYDFKSAYLNWRALKNIQWGFIDTGLLKRINECHYQTLKGQYYCFYALSRVFTELKTITKSITSLRNSLFSFIYHSITNKALFYDKKHFESLSKDWYQLEKVWQPLQLIYKNTLLQLELSALKVPQALLKEAYETVLKEYEGCQKFYQKFLQVQQHYLNSLKESPVSTEFDVSAFHPSFN